MQALWYAWYGDMETDLSFPGGWQVTTAAMTDAEAVDTQAVGRALSDPIGTAPLKELAGGARTAAIVVEDVTRPTPTAQILPRILAELEEGGITPDRVRIIIGTGAHMPMHRAELLKKLGRQILESVEVIQHNCYENLVYLGESTRGTPIYISRAFLDMELRLAVGSITPHPYTGFGGGAKLVAIGVAGMDTIQANHDRAAAGEAGGVGNVEANPCRADMEEIAAKAGLAFIVNGVVNSRRELADVFAGDPVAAFRAGARYARRVYATQLPPKADIAVLNAYPKDTELAVNNVLNAVGYDASRAVKEGGSVVMMTACPQGVGVHLLFSVNGRGYHADEHDHNYGGQPLIIYSPNLSYLEVQHSYPARTVVLNYWQAVLEELKKRHGAAATVTVFPCASLQMPAH